MKAQVVEPHQDVATGEFQQAEFAADLAKVHSGSAPPEYRDPRQFFSRTYLTEGLSALLIGAAKRLSGAGGDPVLRAARTGHAGLDPGHADDGPGAEGGLVRPG